MATLQRVSFGEHEVPVRLQVKEVLVVVALRHQHGAVDALDPVEAAPQHAVRHLTREVRDSGVRLKGSSFV